MNQSESYTFRAPMPPPSISHLSDQILLADRSTMWYHVLTPSLGDFPLHSEVGTRTVSGTPANPRSSTNAATSKRCRDLQVANNSSLGNRSNKGTSRKIWKNHKISFETAPYFGGQMIDTCISVSWIISFTHQFHTNVNLISMPIWSNRDNSDTHTEQTLELIEIPCMCV